MPRYFFDFQDHQLNIDNVGVSCPDLITARKEAKITLAQVAQDVFSEDKGSFHLSVIVRNDEGNVVYKATLAFSDLKVDHSVGG